MAESNAYPRTHKLVDLLGECFPLDAAFSAFASDLTVIDQYDIPTRYPDGVPGSLPGGMPSQTEAEEAVAVAERVLDFIQPRIP